MWLQEQIMNGTKAWLTGFEEWIGAQEENMKTFPRGGTSLKHLKGQLGRDWSSVMTHEENWGKKHR